MKEYLPCTSETIARSKEIADQERADLARHLIDQGDLETVIKLGLPGPSAEDRARYQQIQDIDALNAMIARHGAKRVADWILAICAQREGRIDT